MPSAATNPGSTSPPAPAAGRRATLYEAAMGTLALLMLVLLTLDLAVPLSPLWERRVRLGEWLIWQLFLVEFLVRLFLAPDRAQFARRNWLMALALVLPFLRVFRAAAALHAGLGVPAVRAAAVARAGLGKVAVLIAGQRLLCALFTVAVVVFSAALGVLLVERSVPGANIRDYGDALWWAAGTVTTVGTELYPVTGEGRIIAIVVMVFGVSVFGYVAASIAALLVPAAAAHPGDEPGGLSAAEARQLRQSAAELQELVRRLRTEGEGDPPPDARQE